MTDHIGSMTTNAIMLPSKGYEGEVLVWLLEENGEPALYSRSLSAEDIRHLRECNGCYAAVLRNGLHDADGQPLSDATPECEDPRPWWEQDDDPVSLRDEV